LRLLRERLAVPEENCTEVWLCGKNKAKVKVGSSVHKGGASW
jgi:hypothetical protein